MMIANELVFKFKIESCYILYNKYFNDKILQLTNDLSSD